MTQTDPDLRDRIADALLTTRRADYADLGVKANHREHRFDARCALCTYDVDALAVAALAAVLPAPTDQTAEAPLSPDYEHPECGFHWHGRDGMDIPMRDGQPVCPRCELRKVERRLAHFERRCTELREESLRRGKNVLDHSEKTRALEREIDGVRRQLGAEILRANRAEAELRRLPDEVHPATVVWDFEGEYEADKWHGIGNTYREYGQALGYLRRRAETDKEHRRIRMVRATTTYTVEAECTPTTPSRSGQPETDPEARS